MLSELRVYMSFLWHVEQVSQHYSDPPPNALAQLFHTGLTLTLAAILKLAGRVWHREKRAG